ncbi:MAG: hypothetical protein A2X86_07175 [Bdellovibrionales bacterium GWA2_49_15]|nr:MAG: hypothetical protein A2X86_07175 [Bdellovibrionales bacterium GWA2_49_15]HAZ11942.1 hypothetical protein [Bdellovibrionales bacterium]
MTKLFLKGLIVFCILVVTTFLMMDVFRAEFGEIDFFTRHGLFFLLFITLFPRLTLLFSSVPFGGFLWWMGFIFCPRILVACLATITYFRTNPLLVVVSWLVAISGETAEKYGIGRNRFHFKIWHPNVGHPRPQGPKKSNSDDAIEAEYKKL